MGGVAIWLRQLSLVQTVSIFNVHCINHFVAKHYSCALNLEEDN